jgi:uroporphyrinogen decarboxylase
MTDRENTLRAFRFQGPEHIPVRVSIPPQAWREYDPAEIEDIMLAHPFLFPGFRRGQVNPAAITFPPELRKDTPYRDGWGSVWQTPADGMYPAVVEHVLADWNRFADLRPPDPAHSDGMRPVDWAAVRHGVAETRRQGGLVWLGLPHGHTFLRLQDLRGYQNLVFDMADADPRLDQLVQMVADFNAEFARRCLELKPDIFGIPEDLGMQRTPMLSPALFRRYIKPVYQRLTAPARAVGILVHEHVDGCIVDLLEDLVEAGGDIINLQDRVNGIDTIARLLKGRVAIDLDIDRQHVTMTGSERDIDELIREPVLKLGSRAGGLALMYHAWHPTPPRCIRAVCAAMEKYCRHWAA